MSKFNFVTIQDTDIYDTSFQTARNVSLCWDFLAQSTTRSCWAGQLIVVLFLDRFRLSKWLIVLSEDVLRSN